jgi:ABC-type multidrug transport system ATPase subunit
MIDLTNINYSYNNLKIIENYSISIKKEGITVISGPNGSGKTTLLKIISKIIEPDSGSVKVLDKDLYNKLGFVFQRPVLLKRNVYENISYILKQTKLPSNEIKSLIDEYLSKFLNRRQNLSDFLEKNIFELSGGEQQLVSLVRTFISKPNILFLDEPFTNLDDSYCDSLTSLISEISSNNKCKIIMVTHKHNIANKLTSDIISL